MQGKPNCARLALLLESVAEKLWQKHEMIIMHPDQGAGVGCLDNGVCKQFVDSFVGLPWTIVKYDA